jgi:hypothetical protein
MPRHIAAGTNDPQLLVTLTKGCGQKTRSLALLAALTKGLQRIADLKHVGRELKAAVHREVKAAVQREVKAAVQRELKAAVQRQFNRCIQPLHPPRLKPVYLQPKVCRY